MLGRVPTGNEVSCFISCICFFLFVKLIWNPIFFYSTLFLLGSIIILSPLIEQWSSKLKREWGLSGNFFFCSFFLPFLLLFLFLFFFRDSLKEKLKVRPGRNEEKVKRIVEGKEGEGRNVGVEEKKKVGVARVLAWEQPEKGKDREEGEKGDEQKANGREDEEDIILDLV